MSSSRFLAGIHRRVRNDFPGKRATIAVGAYLAIYLTWQLFRWGGHAHQATIGDLAYWPLNAIGVWVAWNAAPGGHDARLRRAWRILAVAMAMYLLGDVLQFVYESILGNKPYPSWDDAAYLAFGPVMLLGLLAFPVRRASWRHRLRMLIDCVTVALGGGAIVWYVVLGPTAGATTNLNLASIASLAYPVGDLMLIVGVANVLLRRTVPSAQSALGVVAAGLIFYVAGDMVYGYISLHGTYTGGDPVDILWMVAQGMFVVAAGIQRDHAADADALHAPVRRGPRGVSWLPYVALAVLFALMAIAERRDALIPTGALVLAAIVATTLVSARQLITQRDLLHLHRELQHAHDDLAALATTDPLTGLANHRAMVAAIDAEIERCRRFRQQCALLFFDVDHFKQLNDVHGHAEGDRALWRLAEISRAQLRTVDIVGRFGGEEFVALLPQTSRESALVAAERLRVALATEPVSADGTLHLTCSIGVSVFPEDASDRSELLEAADRAMYGAKRLGRNQTLAASDPAVSALQGAASDWGLDRPGALAHAVEGLAMLVDIRDSYTDQHAGEVSTLARTIAGHLGCRGDAAQDVALAARLHDIGKVAIPDAILRKAGSLTEEEWKLIRTHPRVGADVVERIPLLGGLAPIIGAHHERWDGRGYPDGLAGEAIPLAARIIAVADAYNAMTTKRPYRDALPIDVAIEELERGAGSQFDPDVVRAAIEILADDPSGTPRPEPSHVSAPADG